MVEARLIKRIQPLFNTKLKGRKKWTSTHTI
jgi:excinuclease UvrABC nuclease subunit